MLHEVFHFFTHLDKGFLFTLKQLIRYPGKMQREYINGLRAKHQKPFSMFFICATVAGLSLYTVNLLLIKYFGAGNDKEAQFFNHYWVVLQIALLPFYTLVTYLFFRQPNLNYAEVGVLQLYRFAIVFLLISIISLIRFILPDFQTKFLEFPIILIYSIITNLSFFHTSNRGIVIVKSIVIMIIAFGIASLVQAWLVGT